jgi:hypothetical protein
MYRGSSIVVELQYCTYCKDKLFCVCSNVIEK